MLEDLRTRLLHIQPPSCGFLDPFLTVAITVETDRLTGLDILTQHVEDGRYLIVSVCGLGIYPALELLQGFSHGRVQGDHGRGAVG